MISAGRSDDRLRVLSVCIGNVCRSPVSEFLLHHELGDRIDSSSAGTHALVGQPVHPPMAARLDDLGVAHAGAARQLSEGMLREADLVLTMTTQLRSRVVELAPAAVRRTFTLAEFAVILHILPRPDVRPSGRSDLLPVIAGAAAQRSALDSRIGSRDISDPFGREAADYATAFAHVRRCVAAITSAWS